MPTIDSEVETNVVSNKVKLAILIGAPIVLGSGLYLYYNYYHKRGQKEQKNSKKSGKDVNQTKVKHEVDSKPEPVITVITCQLISNIFV